MLRGALAVDEFVNADTIALGLSAYKPDEAAFAAGRAMLERLRFLARKRRNFAFETTLAGRGHLRWIQNLRAGGYHAHLIFLSLPSADLAVARVAERVRRGGHHVPEDVVRRRFAAGLRNLLTRVDDAVDSWQVYDNSRLPPPRLIASRSLGAPVVVTDHEAWQNLRGRMRRS